MGKTILVSDGLSDAMIDAGAKLLGRLDAQEIDVKSAFWLYSSEDRLWRLMLASPLIDIEGPLEYYRKIMEANCGVEDNEPTISLHDVVAVSTSDQLVKSFGAAVTPDDLTEGLRFSRNAIKGFFIEDAYIYRSNP